jgi:hypothetical protein
MEVLAMLELLGILGYSEKVAFTLYFTVKPVFMRSSMVNDFI